MLPFVACLGLSACDVEPSEGPSTRSAEALGAAQPAGEDSLVVTPQGKWTITLGLSVSPSGTAVDLSGNTAIVGAPDESWSSLRTASGKALVFAQSGNQWGLQFATQPDSQTAKYMFFGRAVAIDGDIALVGCPGEPGAQFFTTPGAVYIYARSGSIWTREAKLLPPGLEWSSISFGNTLAFDGDTALIGSTAGLLFVFRRSGGVWTHEAMLKPGDLGPNDKLGTSVALELDRALVSNKAATGNNAVYVFERNGTTWTQTAKLLASDGVPGDCFGSSVALKGNMALVGASCQDTMAGSAAGAAYVFTESGGVWTEQAKLLATRRRPAMV